jgi:hypothetical protein
MRQLLLHRYVLVAGIAVVPRLAFLEVLLLPPDTHFRHRKHSADPTHLPGVVAPHNSHRRPECGPFEPCRAPAS